MLASMRALLLLLAACGSLASTTPAPAPDLALEVTPANFGAQAPGDPPEVTVTLVNNSQRTIELPRPGPWAVTMPGAMHYELEHAKADGTWEELQPVYYMAIDRYPGEDPDATIELPPGARITLDKRGLPPLSFPKDKFGKLRGRLVYDVDVEWKRRNVSAPHVEPITSNVVEIEQLPGPLEVKLEVLAKIVIGQPIDPSRVLRVTVRNRTNHDVTVFGLGEESGIAIQTNSINDEPQILHDGPMKPRVLHANEAFEVLGPNAPLGVSRPWICEDAAPFALRANFYQPTPQRFHYSDWVPVQSAR